MSRKPVQRNRPAGEGAKTFPFTALVGQEEMKLALALNLIDPLIGGVIIMGHRGTGKSTAVRALADLLPPITRVKDCPYNCDPARDSELCADCKDRKDRSDALPSERAPIPVVDLPLGATEDRICGTLDIEKALAAGVKSFEPGLLARANRGFLYIDEVNLLDDHLVDVLLDAAASGRNIVEREGISVSHPSRFVLVGSGNPEEGELRPQLLDRFGLFTQVYTITDIDQRVEIIERRESFERDPAAFAARSRPEQLRLRKRLVKAGTSLSRVDIDRSILRMTAELCIALGVDGHRGELTIMRSARALAAFNDRDRVSVEDVRAVSALSLRHRLRKDPLESIDSSARIEQAFDDIFSRSIHGKRLSAIK
jgi:magnesium chelatase subunit I